jgi:hypothetical protein
MSHALVVEWDESTSRNLPSPIFHFFMVMLGLVTIPASMNNIQRYAYK